MIYVAGHLRVPFAIQKKPLGEVPAGIREVDRVADNKAN
jgi:hypothetical protein